MNKKDVQERIAILERHLTGFNKLAGRAVKVTNLRSTRNSYIANITLIDIEEGHSEKFKDCEYPKKVVEGLTV